MKKAVAFAAAVVFVLTAAADDIDAMSVCDNNYNRCTASCDGQENVSSDCYSACDQVYQKCLDVANGYTPEPSASQNALAKLHDQNGEAGKQVRSEGQDKRTEPDGSGHEQ